MVAVAEGDTGIVVPEEPEAEAQASEEDEDKDSNRPRWKKF